MHLLLASASEILVETGTAVGGFALGYLILREVREIHRHLKHPNGEA